MKNTLIISATVILFFATQICECGCKVNAQTSNINQESIPQTQTKTVTLKITGMTCGGCSKTIHSSLSKKDGILENEVKFPGDMAIVKYDPAKITEKEIVAIIEKAGYKTEIIKEEIKNADGKTETKSNKKCGVDCKKSCCSKK